MKAYTVTYNLFTHTLNHAVNGNKYINFFTRYPGSTTVLKENKYVRDTLCSCIVGIDEVKMPYIHVCGHTHMYVVHDIHYIIPVYPV